MGPRSHERGNRIIRERGGKRAFTLQWGRVLMNAETHATIGRAGSCNSCFNGAAFS